MIGLAGPQARATASRMRAGTATAATAGQDQAVVAAPPRPRSPRRACAPSSARVSSRAAIAALTGSDGQPHGLLGEPGGRLRVAAPARPRPGRAAAWARPRRRPAPRRRSCAGPGSIRTAPSSAPPWTVARAARRGRGVADADPLAGVDRVDHRPGQAVHPERVHHRQAVAVLDHLRPQRERVGHAGDQQQDGGQERAEPRRGQPLGRVVGDVGQRRTPPTPTRR